MPAHCIQRVGLAPPPWPCAQKHRKGNFLENEKIDKIVKHLRKKVSEIVKKYSKIVKNTPMPVQCVERVGLDHPPWLCAQERPRWPWSAQP
jgi:hypothetical protein